MSARGDNALAVAREEWSRPVRSKDDSGATRILDEYIKGPQGLGWTWTKSLSGFNWCGAFAAFVWQAVRLDLRKEHFASTPRLDSWAENTARAIPVRPDAVQPGDIILVGPQRGYTNEFGTTYKHGRHIAIVESVRSDGVVNTIEGNSVGEMPDGEKRHGVIKDVRFFPSANMEPSDWRIVAVIRPLEEDFESPLATVDGGGRVARFAKASVVIGLGALGVAVLGAAVWYYMRKRKKRRRK